MEVVFWHALACLLCSEVCAWACESWGVNPGVNQTHDLQVLVKLEEVMREALRRRAALHVKERTVLLRAFGQVLGRRDVEISQSVKVGPPQFAEVWKALGVPLTDQHCFALFNKYGQDVKGRMPVLVRGFCRWRCGGSQRSISDLCPRSPPLVSTRPSPLRTLWTLLCLALRGS